MKIQINSNKADYLAAHINTHAEKDASVFVISDMDCNEFEKYLTFKSKRNIIRVWDIQQADSLSNLLGKEKSIVFVHHSDKAEIEAFAVFSESSP